MLVGRYWSITNHPFHVFWKILIPSLRFFKSDSTDLQDCVGTHFQSLDCQQCEISKIIYCEVVRHFSWILLSILVSPKLHIGFGSHGRVPNSENNANDGSSVFPKRNRKVTSPKWRANNYTELLCDSSLNICYRNDTNMTNTCLNISSYNYPNFSV